MKLYTHHDNKGAEACSYKVISTNAHNTPMIAISFSKCKQLHNPPCVFIYVRRQHQRYVIQTGSHSFIISRTGSITYYVVTIVLYIYS